MAKFYSSYREAEGQKVGDAACLSDLQQIAPLLVEALAGRQGENGSDTLPPCTLTLFVEGSRMKFCLSPKFGPLVCFGVVSEPAKGLMSVETALYDGEYEWKKRTVRQSR